MSAPCPTTASPSSPTLGRAVPARIIPVPDTVSPEMREWLANPVPPMTTTIPQSADEWRKLVALHFELRSPVIAELREAYPVSVDVEQRAGVSCRLITPAVVPAVNRTRMVMHLHGGAYVFSPGELGASEGIILAHFGQMPVVSVDYRMPPDHPFPAALDDALAVYRELVKTHRPADIALFGTSAGGGLAAALLLKLRELRLPMPAALGLGTPWADLTKTGDTLLTCEDIDQVLLHYDGPLAAAARMYAGSYDLSDPLISPVNGDLSGFPPTILIAGTRDMLLSCTVRMHRKLLAAGVPAELHVFEAMPHGFYLGLPNSPESRETFAQVAEFFTRRLQAANS